MDKHHIILSPSINHYLKAGKNKTSNQRVYIYKGTSDKLDKIDSELKSILNRAGPEATYNERSCRADWPDNDNARVWHYSGHADFCRENPFYSSLILNDGPLFAADFQLKSNCVNLIFLAACRSGQQMALPGEESSGLVRSLIEMGGRNIIASNWPVSDDSAALWSTSFYKKFFNNNDINVSYRYASIKVREQYKSAFHWAAFSLYGAGNMGGKK